MFCEKGRSDTNTILNDKQKLLNEKRYGKVNLFLDKMSGTKINLSSNLNKCGVQSDPFLAILILVSLHSTKDI